MKKKLKIFFIIIISLILTGCIPNLNDIKELNSYKKQAKQNAINYIKDKYGFDIKIKNINIDGYLDPLELDYKNQSTALIKAEANNKNFNIYITGKKESLEGIDDYQTEEIEKDYLSSILNEIQIEPKDYQFEYSVNYANQVNKTNLINEYYDKNNLNEIIKHIKKLNLYFITDINLSTLNLTNYQNNYPNANINLITFKTEKEYKQYKQEYLNEKAYNNDNRLIIYKQSELILKKENLEYYEYNKSNYNNDVYIYTQTNNNIQIQESVENINLDKIKEKIYKDSNLTSKYKNIVIEQITKTYEIPCEDIIHYIYFPLNKKLNSNTIPNMPQTIKEYELIFAYEYIKDNNVLYDLSYNIREFTATSYYHNQHRFLNCNKDYSIKFTILHAKEKD